MTDKIKNEYDRLVFMTLAYSSCFNFALTQEEIIKRLPFSKQLLFSRKKIIDSLKKLVDEGIIYSDGTFFYLDAKDLKNRQQKSRHIIKKEQEVEKLLSLVKRIPTIKALVLTGSTAVGNAKPDDDLDFMVICKKNTLWLSRLLLIILTKMKKKRPFGNVKNAWCFNLYLDEKDLKLRSNRHSLYEAYEILQMQFVYDCGEVQQAFLNANSWLREHLFFYQNYTFKKYQSQRSFSLLNYLLFIMQKAYRRLVFGVEAFYLSQTQAFFNEIAFREKILEAFNKKIEKNFAR